MTCNRKDIEIHALAFKSAILACESGSLTESLQDYPRGSCDDASWLLARYLGEMGCGIFTHIVGTNGGIIPSHVWWKQDLFIVDITAYQFIDNNHQVIFSADEKWYLQFNTEINPYTDYRQYPGHQPFVQELNHSYDQVLAKLNQVE